jgi:hypothetical protein
MAQRVKINFGKHPFMTTIRDADTGEMLTNVFRLELVVVDVNNQVFEVKLAEIEEGLGLEQIEGEVEATVIEKIALSDATLDTLARMVERRIAARLKYSSGRQR